MHQEEKDGWREWSKHILNALERLDKQLDTVRNDINKANLDIAKLGYLSSALMEVEKNLTSIREDITHQSETFKAAVSTLEDEDANSLKVLEEKVDAISKKVDIKDEQMNRRVISLEQFETRTKTIAWIVGTILMAIIGMMSISLTDIFN